MGTFRKKIVPLSMASSTHVFSIRPQSPVIRSYRLVDQYGSPHPVLDDLYDSLESAWSEATLWWQAQAPGTPEPLGIGVEVSTSTGNWRTLRHPAC